jgi:hypothetical protein
VLDQRRTGRSGAGLYLLVRSTRGEVLALGSPWRTLSRFQAVPAAVSRPCWQSFNNAALPPSRNQVGGSSPKKSSAMAEHGPG